LILLCQEFTLQFPRIIINSSSLYYRFLVNKSRVSDLVSGWLVVMHTYNQTSCVVLLFAVIVTLPRKSGRNC